MVAPSDSPTPPAPRDQQHELPLNDDTSATHLQDFADEPFTSEVDALSTAVALMATLERRHVVPARAATQPRARPVDLPATPTPTRETDRSWRWRLRAWLPASTGPQPHTHLEPRTLEAIRNLEIQLAGLPALRNVCTRIDQRLARLEAGLQRTESYMADKPSDLSAVTYQRLERIEDAVRLTQQSLSDAMLPEMCVNIERQLIQTRQALERTEDAMADPTVRHICENIEGGLARTEDNLRRTERAVVDSFGELWARMSGRLAEAEDAIQRIESHVSAGALEETTIRELLTRVDRRLEQAVEAVPSREGVLGREKADVEPADGVLARAGLLLRRVTAASSSSVEVFGSKWAPLSVAAVVLVTAVGLAALIQTAPGGTPNGPEAAGTRQTDRASSSAVEDTRTQPAAPVDAKVPTLSTARPVTRLVALTTDTPSVPKATTVAPRSQPSSPEPGPITSKRRVFVGTLSIASVPPGATVSINGKRAGVTPLKLSGHRAGSSAVQISREGFERWSASVRVPADRVTEVDARLRPLLAP